MLHYKYIGSLTFEFPATVYKNHCDDETVARSCSLFAAVGGWADIL